MTVPSLPSSADKKALRAAMRARRKDYAASLAPSLRIALEGEVARILEPLLFAAKVVAAYQPMKEELSPLPALEMARAMGKTTVLPAFAARDSRMTFHEGDATAAGPWGLLQPPIDSPPLAPDLVLVPLIACDLLGNRIGMGQGHYDRALEGLRGQATLVGIGWDFQLLADTFAADPWDQPLHAFAAPSGLTEFST
ncbi:5-formyltetrahydrofolate cyclo-ligase [Sphingomonas rosea]